MSGAVDVRYGVFLVPDAATSAVVTDITGYLRAQFGFVSAGRFPPHVTLVGSLALAVEESALLAVVQEVADRRGPVELTNRGVHRLADAVVVLDVHHTTGAEPNVALLDLAEDVGRSVVPLLRPTELLPADLRSRDDWFGHLSLASHELLDRPDLRDEVEEFVRQLPVTWPPSFQAARLTVYRLHHPDWSTGWWSDFSWDHVRSFPLRSPGPH